MFPMKFLLSLNTNEPPLEITKIKEINGYILVRAANMKVTFDKNTAMIVNVSGGGCPDVPFLAQNLMGKRLEEAMVVMEKGHSLCAYMLKRAIEKGLELLNENH